MRSDMNALVTKMDEFVKTKKGNPLAIKKEIDELIKKADKEGVTFASDVTKTLNYGLLRKLWDLLVPFLNESDDQKQEFCEAQASPRSTRLYSCAIKRVYPRKLY